MKLTFPDYYKKFTCIADKCTDTCCAGWDVVIDGKSLEKYANLSGEYGKKIRGLITLDEDGDSIFAARNGKCPFLLENGLCDMYINIGHGNLCRTCRVFPRFTNAFGARAETGLSLSCPEAARLIFESENPVIFETEETDGAIIPSDFDAELYFTLLKARKTAINILQSRKFSAKERICAFLRYCEAAQKYINEYEYGGIDGLCADDFLNEHSEFLPARAKRALKGIFAAFDTAEFISPDYSAKLKAAQSADMQGFAAPDAELEHLSVYFVYRYFITAAYDGKLFEKAALAAACTATILRLWASENALKKEKRTEIAQKFSKEIEHSAMNMQLLTRAIKKKPLLQRRKPDKYFFRKGEIKMRYCDFVNTKQGSKSVHRYSNGNTLPLVQLPFGMAAFAPQTVENNVRWYYHPDSRSFEGIRLTHQPSPWIADYGAMVFMPQNKKLGGFDGEDRWSGFRPEDAVLTPYCLKFRLLRSRSDIELAPTERGAAVRISFDEDGDNYFSVLPVKGMCSYRFDAKTNTLYASTDMHMSGEAVKFRNYIVFRFPKGSVDADKTLISSDDKFRSGTKCRGKKAGIHIYLNQKVTEIKLASSYISYEQALLNLETELSGKSLEDVKAFAEETWESYLSRIRIETKDEKMLKTFYSCMYRAFLYPHKCYEYDKNGNPVHYCPHDGSIRSGVRYTDNGFWDTYRTVYPFFALVAKDELREMLVAFINEYKESGWLPRWLSIGECGCMPSTLVDAVICDGAVKGFIEKDMLELALEGMIKHSVTNAPHKRFGRNGAEEYCKLGYVSYETEKESVNLTLDAAYGDWCIAEIAKILGKKDIEKEYRKRALNYKNLFDPETGFMRAKDKKGAFRPDFTPIGWGRDYTEGSAWQNSFAVPHDIDGLADLYGGKDKLIEKIDELFAAPPHYEIIGYGCEIHEITEMAAVDFGQCGMNNQPSFHIPYIYSALGNVEKSAYWVRKICDELFSYEDDGFPGDEDNGTTAIWYIFGVLGLYPFCPGRPEYVKGIKQVDKAFIGEKELDVNKFDGNKIQYKDLI